MDSPILDPEALARSWIGTPFVHQGRLPGVQLDCAGMIICIARTRGHVPPDWDVPNYAAQPDKSNIVDACEQHLRRIPIADAQPGDVLCIAWDRWPQHLGILGVYAPLRTERTLIHAFARQGERAPVLREHRLTPDLWRHVVSAYTWPEID